MLVNPPETLREWSMLANQIVARLLPLAERVVIAGSIRRGRSVVGDVDLVILDRDGAARERIRRAPGSKIVLDGPQNLILRLRSGAQLDCFFARRAVADMFQPRPPNFGTLLLCRTGPREFNIALVARAKELGLEWKPYSGVVDPEVGMLAAEDEREVLAALGLNWIPPEQRDDAAGNLDQWICR